MKRKPGLLKMVGVLLLALVSLTVFSVGSSSGAVVDFYLKAEVINKVMPDGKTIMMWGFADCGSDSTFTTCRPASSPGPTLTVTEGDRVRVTLRNNLTGKYKEPVSIMIPGQLKTVMKPVKFTDGTGRQRTKSFTKRTFVGATKTYVWWNVKAGTYLYQSGTHPALQVQMGLFGAFIVNPATPGQAYNDASTAYDAQSVVLFSEIDPDLHYAVERGNYGPNKGVKSTVRYRPRYFLINGHPYSPGISPVPAGLPASRVLLRFLNAGLESHVPVTQGLYMNILAEDGNLLPYPREQYSLLLPAGKTMDAIVLPQASGNYALYDRALRLSSGSGSLGGMLTYLNVSSPFASVSPALNDFGVVMTGNTSLPVTFTVSNNGSATLPLGVLALAGSGAPEFSVQNDTCSGTSLAPLASCTVDARFSPVLNGIKSADLVITSLSGVIPTPSVALRGCAPFFADVPPGYWAGNFIHNMFCKGIMDGCGNGNFCPDAWTTRAEMITFVMKAISQASAICTGNIFDDVNAATVGDEVCRYIEKAKSLKFTSGCSTDDFCPSNPVTRAQMAVFTLKGMNQPPAPACTGTVFNDVNAGTVGAGFCRYIEQAAALGITSGCGGGNYCPFGWLTRAEASVFVSAAFFP